MYVHTYVRTSVTVSSSHTYAPSFLDSWGVAFDVSVWYSVSADDVPFQLAWKETVCLPNMYYVGLLVSVCMCVCVCVGGGGGGGGWGGGYVSVCMCVCVCV